MKKINRKRKLSSTSALHYFKLVYRSLLFLGAVAVYIFTRLEDTGDAFGMVERHPVVLWIIWLVFVVEMALRFFPSRFESMGCQKQFLRNYIPAENKKRREIVAPTSTKSIVLIALAWLLLNGIIGGLYLLGVFDKDILILVALAFSVCDMVCILFFCPFQTLFMLNKCCGSCRIYNWDFAMMFTPLAFVPGIYSWSLLAMAVALLIKWEVLYSMHPERFSEETNASLACANCKEKLCQHKTQLRRFLLLKLKHRNHISNI